jgi:CheY-like chemotaxis protein
MTAEERARVEVLVAGHRIGPMPEGPRIESFDPLQLAEAIEREATRAMIAFDVPKVDLRMDATDALALAKWLRQAPGQGA